MKNAQKFDGTCLEYSRTVRRQRNPIHSCPAMVKVTDAVSLKDEIVLPSGLLLAGSAQKIHTDHGGKGFDARTRTVMGEVLHSGSFDFTNTDTIEFKEGDVIQMVGTHFDVEWDKGRVVACRDGMWVEVHLPFVACVWRDGKPLAPPSYLLVEIAPKGKELFVPQGGLFVKQDKPSDRGLVLDTGHDYENLLEGLKPGDTAIWKASPRPYNVSGNTWRLSVRAVVSWE